MTNEIIEKYGEYQLCLVSGSFAHFTDCPLNLQWGDDWDDAPFEHNAGSPYANHDEGGERVKHDVFSVFIAGGFDYPDSYQLNSAYSVEQINDKEVAWMKTDRHNVKWQGCENVEVWAGATFAEFLDYVRRAKAVIYFPAQWVVPEMELGNGKSKPIYTLPPITLQGMDATDKDLDTLVVETYRDLVTQANILVPQWEAFYRPVIYCPSVLVDKVAKYEGKYVLIDGDILEVIADDSIPLTSEMTDLYIRFLEVVE